MDLNSYYYKEGEEGNVDKKDMHELIQKIGTTEDEVERRDLLAKMDESIDPIYDERDKALEQSRQLSEDNEKVRAANMKLFTQLGAERTEEEVRKEMTGIDEPAEAPRRSFKDLFNEKGELKK